jgi:hypothetical protein
VTSPVTTTLSPLFTHPPKPHHTSRGGRPDGAGSGNGGGGRRPRAAGLLQRAHGRCVPCS